MEQLDSTVQDARALLKTAQKYQIAPHTDGIDTDLIDLLAGAIERALAADATQRNAIRDVDRYTADQDKAMDGALLFIRKLQAAAKARYKTSDGPMMREFRVGAKPSQTVKGMTIDLSYLKGVAEKRAADLTKFGFKPADIAALGQATNDLAQADLSQELAKKAQVNATEARNQSVKDLKQVMQQVRNSAKSVFAVRKDVLREFETITRAKKSKAKESSAGAGS